MVFGRRNRASTTREAIIEFWTWWPSVRTPLTAGIDAGDGGAPLAGEIARRVTAIHPKLDWELGKGLVARHGVTLSPAGNPELRAAAARWLALAPPPDDVWEFHDARQAVPGFATMRLQFDGHDLNLGDVRFGVAGNEHSVDVSVFHPVFARLAENARLRIAFLCLDWALGEQAVEVWVGEISAMATAPGQADTVDGLRATVAGLVQRHQEPQWVILGGSTPETERLMAVAQVPLRAARWPRFDTHVAVTLSFPDRGNGLPTNDALAELRAFEDSVGPMLGRDGELLAHETGNGIRTLHYYVDGESEAVARLAGRTSQWPGARSTVTHDPALKAIRHLDVSR
jgi:hypothetical protein